MSEITDDDWREMGFDPYDPADWATMSLISWELLHDR